MKRQDFLNQLRQELSGIPNDQINEIIRDHEEIINDALGAGRHEDDIIRSFGDIRELAKTLKVEFKIDKATDEKKISSQARALLGALGALLLLAPFNLIFVLGPFCAVLGVVVAFWSVIGAMAILSLVLMGAFFTKFIFVGASLFVYLSAFFAILGVMGLICLGTVAMYFVTKAIFKLILSYFRWNLNFIKNRS